MEDYDRLPALPPEPPRRMTLGQFETLVSVLRFKGYDDMIAWGEERRPPLDARSFAREAIYVICNSGMSVVVANPIYRRCVRALNRRQSARTVFGHPAKAHAIDHIWCHRRALFEAYKVAENKTAYCLTLPYIGRVTQYHLARNLGENAVTPDVHLVRLARWEHATPLDMCERLAFLSGYRVGTVDAVLWRACADRYLDSREYEKGGWYAAFLPPIGWNG